MDSKRFIDFKKSMAIENLNKQNKLKRTYFEYLNLESVIAKEADEKFLQHYNQEIIGWGLEKKILKLMEQWKKEYNEKSKNIDPTLLKEIKQNTYELYINGYDRNRILLVLKAVFGKRISKPIIIEKFLSDIMNSYLDGITR